MEEGAQALPQHLTHPQGACPSLCPCPCPCSWPWPWPWGRSWAQKALLRGTDKGTTIPGFRSKKKGKEVNHKQGLLRRRHVGAEFRVCTPCRRESMSLVRPRCWTPLPPWRAHIQVACLLARGQAAAGLQLGCLVAKKAGK